MTITRWRRSKRLAAVLAAVATAHVSPSVTAAMMTSELVSVSGQVVHATTEAPIRLAVVVAWGARTGTLRAVLSDGNGGFTFDGLPEDDYQVGAAKKPFLSSVAPAGSGTTIVRLTPGATISGTVTDSLGKPAFGVSVTARSAAGLTSGAVTDRRGWYRIHTLAAGEYSVSVERATQVHAVTLAAGEDRQGTHLSQLPAPAADGGDAAGPGSIAGIVTDRDNDPVPDVTVALTGGASRRTRTDATGAFVFTGLPAALHKLQVADPAFGAVGTAQVSPTSEPVTGVPLRTTRLAAIGGVVRDEAGDPVVGAAVTALRRTSTGFHRLLMPRGQAHTDDRGEYWIGGLLDGDYVVCVCGPSQPPIDPGLAMNLTGGKASAERVSQLAAQLPVVAPTLHPGRTRAADAITVELAPGDDRQGTDITLTRVRAFRVAGQLTATDARFLSRASVRLVASGDSSDAWTLAEREPVRLTEKGEFEFASVPEGQYTLAAFSIEDDLAQLAQLELTVGAGDLTGVSLALSPGATVQGQVDLADGTRLGADELEQARIVITPVDLSPATLLRTAATGAAGYSSDLDAQGRFSVAGLAPGKYVVSISGMPSQWSQIESIQTSAGRTPDVVFEVPAGGTQSLTVRMGAQESASLSGTAALDPFEAPDGIRVYLFPADQSAWTDLSRWTSRIHLVSLSNRFTFQFEQVPAGDYIVAVVRPGEVDWSAAQLARWAAAGERLSLAPGESATRTIGGG